MMILYIHVHTISKTSNVIDCCAVSSMGQRGDGLLSTTSCDVCKTNEHGGLWICKNNKCKKCYCINCLENKGYNKNLMYNMTRQWYCSDCIKENEKDILKQKEKLGNLVGNIKRNQKKYQIKRLKCGYNCNISCCSKKDKI